VDGNMTEEVKKMLEEIKEMIQDFLNGQYDPWEFSFDLPALVGKYHVELDAYDPELEYQLEDFSFICSEYEMGDDPEPLKRKIKEAYDKILANAIDQ
jgi:hypothetical protein